MPSAISIVIPTYGRDGVLCDTVASLLALAMPADELLVVDQTPEHDEETTERLTGRNQAGDIRWIRHQPPGVVGAMNRGLREAKGDIVLFLDDDIVPHASLVAAHRQAHVEHPDAWAIVGQVIQPEDADDRGEGGKLKAEMGAEVLRERDESGKLKSEKEAQKDTERKIEDRRQKTDGRDQRSEVRGRVDKCRLQGIESQLSGFNPHSSLISDLDFQFNWTEPAWVENVMAGNLSVIRDKALGIGGFDENFIPPVSYRFETEFAKRIIAAGGRIRFEPAASIRHLRAAHGGTRSLGSHLTSASPLHGVGDYYYALRCGKGLERVCYMLRRPFREVCTKFHLRHPWWIPLKFIGELRALVLALRLHRKRLRPQSLIQFGVH